MIARRQFITLLGGAVAAWPLTARAQQGERMRRIGMLESLKADDKEAQARISAFAQGLKELGWTEGRNVQIDVRFGPQLAHAQPCALAAKNKCLADSNKPRTSAKPTDAAGGLLITFAEWLQPLRRPERGKLLRR